MTSQNQPAPAPEIANIQDQQLATNQQAVPVPMIWGTRKVAVTWLCPILNLTSYDVDNDAKKGANQKGYRGGFAGAFGFGQHTSLIGILKDGKSVYPTAKVWKLDLSIALNDLCLYNSVVWRAKNPQEHASQEYAPDGPQGATYWEEFEYPATGDSDTFDVNAVGTFIIYWGTPTQTVDPLLQPFSNLQPKGNKLGQSHPDYKRVGYIVSRSFNFGTARPSSPDISVIIRRAPEQTIVTGSPAALVNGQANIAAIIAEILTSPNCLGLPTSMIDVDSFQTTAVSLHINASFTAVSLLLDEQKAFRDVIDELLETIDGYLRFNPDTKKIEMGLYCHGVLPTEPNTTALTFDDLAGPIKFTVPGWSKAVDRMQVNFTDHAYAFNTVSESATALSWFFIIGDLRTKSIDRPSVTRRLQARALAGEALRTIGKPPTTAELTVRREKGRACRPGSYVTLPTQLEPDGATVSKYFRITQRTIPAKGPMKLSVQGENSLAPVPYTPGVPPILAIDDTIPKIINARVFEAPTKLTGVDEQIVVLAERPDPAVAGFEVHFDTDTNLYSNLGTMTGWAMQCTLRSNVAITDTTIQITVVSSEVDTNLIGVSPGSLAASDDKLLCVLIQKATTGQILENAGGYPLLEICSISAQALATGGTGNNYDLTVLRGRQGTFANAFLKDGTDNTVATDDAEVWIVERASLVGFSHAYFQTLRDNRIKGASPDTGKFRLLPFTHVAEREESECDDIPFQFPGVPLSSITTHLYHGLRGDTSDPIKFLVDDETVEMSRSPLLYYMWFQAFAPSPTIRGYTITLINPLTGLPNVPYNGTLTPPAESFSSTQIVLSFTYQLEYILYIDVWSTTGAYLRRTVKFDVGPSSVIPKVVGDPLYPKAGAPVWLFGTTPLGATERASFGVITAQPAIDGCTIYWSSRFSVDGVTWSDWTDWVDQSVTPAIHSLLGVADSANQAMMQEFRTYATHDDMVDSDITTVHFDDFTPVTG